jgi:hypothetical protein
MPRDVTLTFDDGSTHQYRNVPDNVTPDQVEARAAQDFRGRQVRNIAGSLSASTIPQSDPRFQAPAPDATAPVPGAQPQPAPSFGDRVAGAAETALATITGATGGALGMAGGALGGIAASIAAGGYGTPEAAQRVQQQAEQGAERFTYAPRTQQGQQQVQALGEVLQQTVPVMGLTGELAGIARVASNAGQSAAAAAPVVARGTTAAARERLAPVVQAAQERIAPGAGRSAEATPGTMGSVGAAGTDIAAQRIATAEQLGFTGDSALTKGQASRNPDQLRFEAETAKTPVGELIRERSANQNHQLAQTVERWIDGTGAETIDNVQTGNRVVDTLTNMKASEKAKVRALYKQAEKAGDMAEPVGTDGLVGFLNENRVGETTAPVLKVAKDELVRLGGASLADDGSLVAGTLDLNKLEAVRKAVNKFTKQEGPDMAMASGIRETLDAMTDGVGGDAYKAARSARIDLARKFENRAVVADLLANRKKMADPKVAAENVFDRVVLKGSQDDVSFMRNLLQSGGEDGAQAWTELRGAAYRYLREQALANSATDQAGRTIFSHAKYLDAVKRLDKNGRLDLVLGKKEAQSARDLAEISAYVLTTPPGTVNHSNTASVVLAALAEAGAAGSMTGLPVPVLTGMKVLSQHLKDRRVRQRVNDALRTAKAKEKAQQATLPAEAIPN